MGNGDIFIFNVPIINITGNIAINAQGSGKIVIPAGVTVNLDGNFQLDSKNSGCSSANPCVFEIEVNGNANFDHNFQSDLVTVVWSGTGTVVVGDNFKNSSNGCMECGAGGCPNFQVNFSDCKDDGGCSGGDFCSQITTCSSDVTIPIITGRPSDQVINLTGTACTQPVSWEPPKASDNCTLSSFTPSHSPGTAFPKGTTVVTYTATDAAGNIATSSFNVTVVDNVPPVITGCPVDITVSTNTSCQAVVDWTAPTFTDNCTGGTLTSNKIPGSTFNKGTTKVTYTATDATGNIDTCSFNVHVVDNVPPLITGCPTNITVSANAMCEAIVNWTAPALTDNCAGGKLTTNKTPGSTFAAGITAVIYTATDAAGNVSVCKFNVIVMNEILFSKCPSDIQLEGNMEGKAIATWVEPTASAPCNEIIITSSHQPGDLYNIGTTEIEYEATDNAGNTSFCHFNITVSKMEIEIDIAKVVTPDGNGINDNWILANIENFKDNKVSIVDRWGGLIFTGNSYDNQNVVWRGTNRSGTPVPTGTYFYTISVRFESENFEKSGFIELIR